MAGKIIWPLALAALVIQAIGCNTLPEQPATLRYCTIATSPLRDLEAARLANKRGLDCLHHGNLGPAADAFRAALVADVEFGPAHNNLGKVYFRQGKWHDAAWEFDGACKLLPRQGEPRNNLGLVLEQGRKFDEAILQYRQAVDLEPDNAEYRGNLARALVRRGNRSPEVRGLLQQIIDGDSRPEWRSWAGRQQALLGAAGPDPAICETPLSKPPTP